jgi:benzylsuccinate CoA-transferase BbsE subunit
MTANVTGAGPLAGLRVVDLTDDSGRFATKLLAECGAAVVRVGQGGPGPAMTDPDAAAAGGLLDWWYDGGKARVDGGPLDLHTDAGRDAYRRLAAAADLVVETEPPGRLATLGIDHPDLVGANPRLTQVSLTPFGRTGPWRDHATSDLVSAALGGVLSVSGLPDQPVNPWGRQAFNVAGFVAASSSTWPCTRRCAPRSSRSSSRTGSTTSSLIPRWRPVRARSTGSGPTRSSPPGRDGC